MTVWPGGTSGSTPGASAASPSAPTTAPPAHSSGRRPVTKAVIPAAGLWLREDVEGAPNLGAVA